MADVIAFHVSAGQRFAVGYCLLWQIRSTVVYVMICKSLLMVLLCACHWYIMPCSSLHNWLCNRVQCNLEFINSLPPKAGGSHFEMIFFKLNPLWKIVSWALAVEFLPSYYMNCCRPCSMLPHGVLPIFLTTSVIVDHFEIGDFKIAMDDTSISTKTFLTVSN